MTDYVIGFGTVTTSDNAMVDIAFLHAGQVSLLHVRSGEAVRSGQPLIDLTADPSALLSFERAQATLDFAKQELARTQALAAQHLATNAQLAAARKAVEDAVAALATERQLGNDRRVEVINAPFDGYIASLAVATGVAPDQQFEGSVAALGGTLNAASKRIDTWIDGPAASDALVPGTAVTVRIAVAQRNGWVVPRQAVLHAAAGDYVFQVAAGKARRVPVQIGLQTDEQTEISGSLDPALPVVTLGNYELQDGSTVHEPAAASASGVKP